MNQQYLEYKERVRRAVNRLTTGNKNMIQMKEYANTLTREQLIELAVVQAGLLEQLKNGILEVQ